ncbi:asparagine synthase-related protein [Actinomadura terrae]|uniref:asparagine synthase-related protein n=1 Tax=Actinomadura terrae TaxID=604353 RepID=UPI001FA7E0C5|nr:asparagine synthase-related protein [Actinomadura terrae]
MSALVGFHGLRGDAAPAQRLRELAGEDGPRAAGDGWMIAAVGGGTLPGDDAPVEIRAGDVTRGLLSGRLFDSADGRRDHRCRDPLPLDWAAPRGELARRRWGRYAAAAVRPDGALVLIRDPIGLLPLFYAPHGTGHVFATRMELLVELLGRRPGFDWEHLGSFMTRGPGPTDRTAFQGVAQLSPGEVVQIADGRTTSEPLWDPVAACADGDAPSPDEVRHALLDCTRAWLAEAESVALDLSGGLDSSSVCWAARNSVADEAALHGRFVRFPLGASVDERPAAERVARFLRTPLTIVDAADRLPLAPTKGRLPRADAPQLQYAEARLNEVLAEEAGPGAEALSGGAGDQLFLMRSTPGYHADHLLGGGLGAGHVLGGLRELWRESTLAERSLPALLAEVGTETARRIRGGTAIPDGMLDAPRPAWLAPDSPPSPLRLPDGIDGLSAARAFQLTGILYWGDAVDREHRNPHRPSVYPMLSQPLVELALRAPMRSLVGHRGDRLLLRDAMAGTLPRAVVDGRSKGSYAGMYQHSLRLHRDLCRELILDGRCVANGLVDPGPALEDLQRTALGFTRGPNWPLYSLLSVEMWCQTWN